MPWATDGSQDTVPFQKIYERFRHPECHEYLFERDGMSNTVTSNAYWRKLYVQAFDMFDKLVLDRRPGIIRTPFDVPETDAEWLATDWSPELDPVRPRAVPPADRRRRTGREVPAGALGRRRAARPRSGDKLRVDKGDHADTWSRFDPADRHGHLPLAA